MRRIFLSCLLLLALLAGCGGEKPAEEAPEETPPAEEAEQVPEREETPEEPALPEEPEKEEAEAPGEAEEPAQPAEPVEQRPAAPAAGETLTASAMEAYAKITESLTFTLYVEEGSGAGWDLSITPENAWNVEGRENLFPISYQWSAASAADWAAQAAAMGAEDLLLEMASPDGAAGLRC